MGSNTPSSPGNFSYPPPGSTLQFNYIDSVVTSWLSFDSDATESYLSVWYWPNADPWTIGFNQTAPANGTGIVPLDFFEDSCLGQLNLHYVASDGSLQRILSPIFNIDTLPQSRAVTWSQDVLALPTSSASAGSTLQASTSASVSASLVTSTASPATTTTSNKSPTVLYSSATSTASPAVTTTSNKVPTVLFSSATSSPLSVSKPSSTNSPDLGTGAIAGIVVGIVVCVGLAATLVFYRLRKTNSAQAEVEVPTHASFQSPFPTYFIAETDGSPLRPNELSGDDHILEMANDNR